MKFSFIAKHRVIWPADWLCGALGVSRAGFYAWLTRPRSQRSRNDEELGTKVRASFLASDRTYGARRVTAFFPAHAGGNNVTKFIPRFSPSRSMACARTKNLSSPSQTALYS